MAGGTGNGLHRTTFGRVLAQEGASVSSTWSESWSLWILHCRIEFIFLRRRQHIAKKFDMSTFIQRHHERVRVHCLANHSKERNDVLPSNRRCDFMHAKCRRSGARHLITSLLIFGVFYFSYSHPYAMDVARLFTYGMLRVTAGLR